jgi:GNAT superfamily N-acetyltransferase
VAAPVLIRPARPADRAALLEQYRLLNAWEDAISHDRLTDADAAEASLTVAEGRAARTGGHILVAERDGAVIGHMFLTFERSAPFHRDRPYAYVMELFVREAERGTGIGRRLLQAAEDLARKAGLRRLLIGVLAGNDRAEGAYRRFGFAPYSMELSKILD